MWVSAKFQEVEITKDSCFNKTTEMKHIDLNNDIWCEIFSYLDLKSIYHLELTSIFFKEVLEKLRFWKRKIIKEFSQFELDGLEIKAEKNYQVTRKLYWSLFHQSHVCNVCKMCFIESICSNIPDCDKCDWLELLEWIYKDFQHQAD